MYMHDVWPVFAYEPLQAPLQRKISITGDRHLDALGGRQRPRERVAGLAYEHILHAKIRTQPVDQVTDLAGTTVQMAAGFEVQDLERRQRGITR
jgi:hypothetical protein